MSTPDLTAQPAPGPEPEPERPMSRHPEAGITVERFGPTSRWVHQITGVLMTVCILTAAILYNGSIAVAVGHRYVVETLHVFSGLALPIAPTLGLVSRAYRDDAHRLNRFTARDWTWLRSRSRRDGAIEVGKFNGGQKLNAALSAGSVGVLLITGAVMYWTGLVDIGRRSGATFVHDWFALALGLLVVGHIVHAVRDRHAMTGILTGRVPLRWARRDHAAWAREIAGPPESERSPRAGSHPPAQRRPPG